MASDTDVCIAANIIHYADHTVVLDPLLYDEGYMHEMADSLSPTGSAEDHIRELESMNNDGSWSVTR